MASEHPEDAIVLDIILPVINGYQVCRRLHDAGVWTPILMLTAKRGEWDEAEALDLGADDCLSKPFSVLVLLAHLRALIRRGAPERWYAWRWETWRSIRSRTCRRGEVDITLTSREFAVLEYLMRRRGEVVTKSDIVANVWDAHFDGDLNVVEAHIGALRRKIDTPFDTHTIHTVRGAGYRLGDR